MSDLIPPWLPMFSALLGVLAVVHGYLWARLVRATGLGRVWRWVASLMLLALAISIPLMFVYGRDQPFPGWQALIWIAYVWMGLLGLLFAFQLGADGLRWLAGLAARLGRAGAGAGAHDPERRAFVSRLVAGATVFATVGVAAFSARAAAMPPQLRKVRVALPRLPESLGGTTIAQISDLHVGVNIGRDYVEDVVRRINALKPDIIAITGDLVDGEASHLAGPIAPIADLKARLGVFFVTGNHEYYSGVEPWLKQIEAMGVRVLRNEHVTIGTGKAGFCLAGVDDSSRQAFANGHGADVGRALLGVDPNQEIVLLAHQPREIFAAARHRVGLQLSGHTHGGQMWPFTWIVPLIQPYVAGLARHGKTQIYVSSGTGHWGPPMRLGTQSEITLIELLRDKERLV